MTSVLDQTGLTYLACEVSYGGNAAAAFATDDTSFAPQWINLNDGDTYKISGDATRDSTQKTWRKVLADSPILGGNFLIHAVPEMVSEQIAVWVYGETQTDVSDNLFTLLEIFEQYDYRIRWTFDEYRETWRCQLADATIGRGSVWTHSLMANVQLTIPRYPDVVREHI